MGTKTGTAASLTPDRLWLVVRSAFWLLAAVCAANAAVCGIQVTERASVLNGAYERIVGRVDFGMNWKLAANRIVRDLALAQLKAAG
jgi:hypothetical protein